jgi:hypothetical protein
LRTRVYLKSPVRENRTPGSVRGRSGNWPSYRDGRRLYALAEQIATYEPLWAWLGGTYTLHGGLMVVGGLMFGWWALRAWWR